MTPGERRRRIEAARQAFGIGAMVTHDLLDQLDGPTDAAVPVVVGLLDLDQLALHTVATQAVGLLSLARQQLGEDGWRELRQVHEAANLRALDSLGQLDDPPAPFTP